MNTLASLFFQNTHIYQDKTLFGFKDGKDWKTISWNKSKELVENIALGLHEIGVKKNDEVLASMLHHLSLSHKMLS